MTAPRRAALLAAVAVVVTAGTASAASEFVYGGTRTATGGAVRNAPRRPMPPPLQRDPAGYPIPRALAHESVTIECSDGYHLGASYLKRARVGARMPGVIFLHDAGKERHQFFPLTIQTAARNCAVLDLDLRGHGENPGLEGNPSRGASQLTDADWKAMLEDVRNAVSYLAIKNEVDGGRLALIGAGLGANLALVAASKPWAASVVCVIGFSPAPDLHGYRPVEAAPAIGTDTAVFLVTNQGDRAAHDAASAILAGVRGRKELFEAVPPPSGALFGGGVYGRVPSWLFGALQPPSNAGPARGSAAGRAAASPRPPAPRPPAADPR